MSSADRLESLDVMRGVAIAAMILVSTPGSWNAVYWPLEHAAWNGWTPTDLVFPFLIFAMGAAVPFALGRRRTARGRVHSHIARRALILFGLGLLLNAIEAPSFTLATFRIPGVLQRIAIVFAVVAVLTERTSWRTQVELAIAALLGYWALMTLVPVPGFGPGVLTPEGNLAAYVDRRIFGTHLANLSWDPEGLLSTIPAVATALAGVFAGDWLKASGRREQLKTVWLALAGAAAIAVALVWEVVFPINKNLWTSSFALFSAGAATVTLAAAHWMLDVKGWRGWDAPFRAFGRNPLAGYALSVALDAALTRWGPGEESAKTAIYQTLFVPWAGALGGEAVSLAYALAYVALWAAILGVLYRRRIFIGV